MNLLELLLQYFFRHQLELKMFHFQTKLYGGHKASDEYLQNFEGNLDKFMEVAQGVYGKFDIKTINIQFNVASDESIINSLDIFISIVKKVSKHFRDQTSLLNILDEIVADAQKLKYLLTFK